MLSQKKGILKQKQDPIDLQEQVKQANKHVRSIELQQLDVDRKHAEAMEHKANAQQITAQTSRDEFYLKLFPMNLESKMAKKWFVLKAAEVVEKLTMRHKVATYEECSAQGA